MNEENTHGAGRIEPTDHPDDTRDVAPTEPAAELDGGLPSVNATEARQGRRGLKTVIVILVIGLTVGGVLLGAQSFLKNVKASALQAKGQAPGADARAMFNPEGGSKGSAKPPKLGAAADDRRGAIGAQALEVQPAAQVAAASAPVGSVKPLRGGDGKVALNAAGHPLGVDEKGSIVEVPEIALAGAGSSAPGRPGAAPGSGTTADRRPPSKFGGALFADGSPTAAAASIGPSSSKAGAPGESPSGGARSDRVAMLTEAMKNVLAGKGAGDGGARKSTGGEQEAPSRATGVSAASRATWMPDQALLLPRGRQADCVLETRIVNELPGFASCKLIANLYGADGKVLLLERGSELQGEYASSNQAGLRRVSIVWSRLRTPKGVEVELGSPATDPLGTTGAPAFVEQRWLERVGAALMISVLKDVVAYELAKNTPPQTSGSVVVAPPGQYTVQTGQDMAEQVIKQTLAVRPTMYVNEGTRISIYVARDLDFSGVYSLSADPGESR